MKQPCYHILSPSYEGSHQTILVKQPDGSVRFCIDYQKLNSVTKKNVYSLPKIDAMINKLAAKKYYSTMDLASRYWQIKLEEEKIDFISSTRLWEFNVMPFCWFLKYYFFSIGLTVTLQAGNIWEMFHNISCKEATIYNYVFDHIIFFNTFVSCWIQCFCFN